MVQVSLAVLPMSHLEIFLLDLQPLSSIILLYLRLLDANVDPISACQSICKGQEEMCHCTESYSLGRISIRQKKREKFLLLKIKKRKRRVTSCCMTSLGQPVEATKFNRKFRNHCVISVNCGSSAVLQANLLFF